MTWGFMVLAVLPLSGGEFRPGVHVGVVYANQSVNPAAGLSIGWWTNPYFAWRARVDASMGAALSNHQMAERAKWRSASMEAVWHARGGRMRGFFGGLGLSRDRYEWDHVNLLQGTRSFSKEATIFHGLIGARFNAHLWIELKLRPVIEGVVPKADNEPYYSLGQFSLGWTF